MLNKSGEHRSFKNNIMLACFTAFTAGMTNIAGVMACYTYTSNVTGHTTSFAEHMLKGNFFEMIMVLGWLLMFLLGAGLAHFLIRSFEYRGPFFAHALPLSLELCLLVLIGFYGTHFYDDSENRTVILSFALLLSMGIQNSSVNTISEGKVKTSHLTGVLTDLGAELSEWLHPRTGRPRTLIQKIQLRFSIIFLYVIGALAGGWLFVRIQFTTFYIIAAALAFIIGYDIIEMNWANHQRQTTN